MESPITDDELCESDMLMFKWWLIVWYLHACCMYFKPTEVHHKIFLQIGLPLRESLCSWLVRHSIAPLASHTWIYVCVCVKSPVCQKKVKIWLMLSKVGCLVCRIIFRIFFPVNYDFLAIFAFTQLVQDKNLTPLQQPNICNGIIQC